MEAKEYILMYEREENYWWFLVKRLFIENWLKKLKLKKESKILDVGCGTGRNLLLLSSWGKVWGIDISSLALRFCRKRGFKNLVKASANKIPFQKNTFNLLTLFDVLYHKKIKNDTLVLKEAYRVLKRKGYLLITDCAYNFLFGPHDIAVQARQRYNLEELEAKIRKAGFEVLRSSYIFFLPFPLFLVERLVAKFFTKKKTEFKQLPFMLNNFLILLGKIENWLLRFVNFPWGSSIIILAKK